MAGQCATRPERVGETLRLGLRDKYGEQAQRVIVRARVVGTATLLESKPVTAAADNLANVDFPRDFATAQALAPGGYTVLWVPAEGGGFLACDGFVIR